MHQSWKIELLGTLRAERGDRVVERFRTRKIAGLLAYLALHRGRAHPREELIELFWPNTEPESGRQNLSQALSSLRHQFESPGLPGGEFLSATRAEIRLNPDACATDVEAFESLLRQARYAEGEYAREQLLASAIDLYRGELLPGFYDDWILERRDRLVELYLAALEERIKRAEKVGDMAQALELARAAVQADPLRESSQRDLIRLLALAGRTSAALRQYRGLKRLLRAELDLPPEPETEALIRHIETRVAEMSHARTAPAPSRRETRQAGRDATREGALPPSGTVTFLAVATEPIRAGTKRTSPAMPPGLRERLLALGGNEVDRSREHLVLAFPRAGDALQAAIAALGSLFRDPKSPLHSPVEPLRPLADPPVASARNEAVRGTEVPDEAARGISCVRMALHTGEISERQPLRDSPAARHAQRLVVASRASQILCSETTGALLRRNGDELPLEDLGIFQLRGDPTPERICLVRIPELRSLEFPPLHAERSYPGNLPVCLTPFFGREQELTELRERLVDSEQRLITVSGSGGMGKTRLALELASRMLDAFPAGIWFVPLAELTDPGQIPSAILSALRLRPQAPPGQMDQVVSAVGGAPALFLFDNFEHLADGGARWVSALLEQGPRIRCLVTSRHRLGLASERENVLSPLPTPTGKETPEGLLKVPSVQLFADRARMVLPDFQVTPGNAEVVGRLCAALEGIPLALELAGARIHVLSPSQMRERLAHRLDFLTSRRSDLSARHRSLRAAMDWSYRLLDTDLQRFFCALSIFPGSWTAEAAEFVCDDPLALDQLAQLHEFSLVQALAGGPQPRFSMLDTMRVYAMEQLPAAIGTALRERHAVYYLARAEEAEEHLTSRDRTRWFDRLTLEQENFNAALDWAAGTVAPIPAGEPAADRSGAPNRVECGLRLAAALCDFWPTRGSAAEGRDRLVKLLKLSSADLDPSVRAKALYAAGHLTYMLGDLIQATASFKECLSLQQSLGDMAGVANAMNSLGNMAFFQGDYPRARELYEACLQIRRELGARRSVAHVLHNLGNLANAEGNYEGSRRFLTESLSIKREFDDPWDIAGSLDSLGNVLANLGDSSMARIQYEASLSARRALGDRQGIAHSLGNLALLAGGDQDWARTVALHQESLAIKRELGDRRGIQSSLTNLGAVSYRLGQHERAARLLACAAEIRQRTGFSMPPAEQAKHDAIVAGVRERLGAERFEAAWEEGRQMREADAVDYALESPPLA